VGRAKTVVVVGAGRLGRSLASKLSLAGHSVVVVDDRAEALAVLSPEFTGFRVRGDAGEVRTLEEAGIARADVVFAATDSDTLNLMVAQAAVAVYGVKEVCARVSDPSRETVYARLGVPTVSPNALAAETFLRRPESACD
jgi:trk system potassium uptake protein TrkA